MRLLRIDGEGDRVWQAPADLHIFVAMLVLWRCLSSTQKCVKSPFTDKEDANEARGPHRELRKLAKERGLNFEVVENKGKGSHYRVKFGNNRTIIKSGELTPTYVKLVKKQLGVD